MSLTPVPFGDKHQRPFQDGLIVGNKAQMSGDLYELFEAGHMESAITGPTGERYFLVRTAPNSYLMYTLGPGLSHSTNGGSSDCYGLQEHLSLDYDQWVWHPGQWPDELKAALGI